MNNGGSMHSGMAPAPHGTTHRRHMMMHMTFFWGKNTEVLFDGWPGYDNLGMYVLSLAVVFLLCLLVEWLSHCKLIRKTSCSHQRAVGAGLLQTLMYTLRIGLGYMVMLAVMSFNGGVFLAAIAGHAAGFFSFGSMAFGKASSATDLPPVNCC